MSSRSGRTLFGLACALLTIPALSAQTITNFPIGLGPIADIATGPDGNLWFTEQNGIGRLTLSGAVTEFHLDVPPGRIIAGPDGNLWFTDPIGIGRMTQDGRYTNFPLPFSGFNKTPLCIAAGPDGRLWYTSTFGGVGRVTVDGVFATFDTGYDGTTGITAGSDGNVWFTTSALSESKICRITPDGFITQYGYYGFLPPIEIVSRPDGNVWFTQPSALSIGEVIVAVGTVAQFPVGVAASRIAASDGFLWLAVDHRILRVATDGTVVETFSVGDNRELVALTRGPDGHLWFADAAGTIGRLAYLRPRRRAVTH